MSFVTAGKQKADHEMNTVQQRHDQKINDVERQRKKEIVELEGRRDYLESAVR